MVKLMKLELKRNRLRSYVSAALIITIVMVGFLYLSAAIPYLDDSQTDIEMFASYSNIATFICMFGMVCFSILSSVMYARFVVEEYSGKRAILLFSYPVNRKEILCAKITIVFLFTVLSMILSGLVAFAVFYTTELFVPICKDTLTIFIIFKTIALLLVYSLMAGALAVISLWFGLWKKSTPVTIVSGTIIVVVACNILGAGISNIFPSMLVSILSIIMASVLIMEIGRKVDVMEVE